MTESKTKKQCRKSNQSVTKIKINFQILNIILLVCVNIFFRPQPNSCVGFFGVVFIRPRPNLSVGFCLILFDHDLIWALAFVWFLFDHNQFWALAFVLVFYSTENKFERWLLCCFFLFDYNQIRHNKLKTIFQIPFLFGEHLLPIFFPFIQ